MPRDQTFLLSCSFRKGCRIRITFNSLFDKGSVWYLWSKRRGIVCVEISLVGHLIDELPRVSDLFWVALCIYTGQAWPLWRGTCSDRRWCCWVPACGFLVRVMVLPSCGYVQLLQLVCLVLLPCGYGWILQFICWFAPHFLTSVCAFIACPYPPC